MALPIAAGLAIAGAASGAVKDLTWERRAGKQLGMQMDYEKQMTKFQREQQMKLWEDTNYKAQVEQMRKAGLNVGLMYEGGGQGGQTAPAGGAAADVPVNDGMGIQMGAQNAMQAMQMQAQIDLTKAQTDKVKAETTNVPLTGNKTEEEIRAAKYINDLNERLLSMEEKARHAEADARFETKNLEANDSAMKYRERHMYKTGSNEPSKAEMEERMRYAKIEQELLQAKAKNDIMKAEAVIKAFEAQMTKDGIPPNSPWYAKLLGDLLNKLGIMDWVNMGKGAVKEAVKQN